MKNKLTPLSKLLIVVLIIGGLVLVVYKTNLLQVIAPGGTQKSTTIGKGEVIKIGVVTWGGYAGGQYFNNGFKPNDQSRYLKDYGFNVDFKILDDFNDSRNAWKTGEVDLLWATVDAFTTEIEGLKEFEPQVIFQADWSRGGDAIVVRRGINTAEDLKGKKIAFAEMTPSHTFLLWMLESSSIDYKEIQPVLVANAIDAADLFKKQQVDAAVVWSPDDADCVSKVVGSKVLQSTRQASHIIADVFVAKKEYVEKNRELLKKLIEGWMIGASEINSSNDVKLKAAKILSEGMQQPEDFCLQAINNVRLCTYGDNVNFFNLKGNYTGVTGEDIYNKMSVKFGKIGYQTQNISSWRMVGNSSLIAAINLTGPQHAAESMTKFTEANANERNASAISSKKVSIAFPTGSYNLDENTKYIIDHEFLDIAKSFANSRIRIEGNTDNTGNASANKVLSEKRARAVVNYLVSEHHFDVNRFVIVGNGPDKPIADNNTDEGRAKNRRTDFELLPE